MLTNSVQINDKNEVDLVIGAAGGTKITTAVAQVMLLMFKYNYNLITAIDHRRLHHQVITIDNVLFIQIFSISIHLQINFYMLTAVTNES